MNQLSNNYSCRAKNEIRKCFVSVSVWLLEFLSAWAVTDMLFPVYTFRILTCDFPPIDKVPRARIPPMKLLDSLPFHLHNATKENSLLLLRPNYNQYANLYFICHPLQNHVQYLACLRFWCEIHLPVNFASVIFG